MALANIFGLIDGRRFGKAFVRDQIKRKVAPHIEMIGPKRIDAMITGDQHFSQLVPEILGEQGVEGIKAELAKYSWANGMFTDEDIGQILPPWFLQVVARHGEKGRAWYATQIAWLRSLFPGNS